MQLIRDVDFDMSFSFIFSPRPGTPAADYPCDLSEETKKQRLYELQQQINTQAMRYSRQMLGTEQRILVEGPSKKDLMELRGRTENNRVVNFVGSAELIGQFVDVKITDVFPNSLRGELVRTEQEMGSPHHYFSSGNDGENPSRRRAGCEHIHAIVVERIIMV